MIIRCHHLREAGVMHECCSHCHVLAGCCIHPLPNGHQIIACCGYSNPLKSGIIEAILAKIPEWEAREGSLSTPKEVDQIRMPSMDKKLPSTIPAIPDRFRPAYQTIQRLEQHDCYLAAFIFGAIARGEATDHSDLNVQVIVDRAKPCRHTNHPIIGGVQLNLIFLSLEQLLERVRREIDRHQRTRPLMIAESMIVFDKTGKLRKMQEGAQYLQPEEISQGEKQRLRLTCLNYNERVTCNLEKASLAALLIMHEGMTVLLMSHYQLNQRWWVSTHRLFSDLPNWDQELAQLIGNFLTTGEIYAKFHWWSAIMAHILQPLDDLRPASANNCRCSTCQNDLSLLLGE